MIPREILKKIRQIELRTNLIVTESAAGARALARFIVRTPVASKANPALNSIRTLKRRERRAPSISFQPSPQFRRFPRAIENRHNTDVVRLDVKVDAVTMKPFEQFRLACFPAGKTKAFRGFQNCLNDVIDFSLEFITQPRLLFVIPKN